MLTRHLIHAACTHSAEGFDWDLFITEGKNIVAECVGTESTITLTLVLNIIDFLL